jgi:hypothetical protein
MPGTKWFCIILGVLLMIGTIIPVPFGLALQTVVSSGVRQKMRELVEDGTLTVNPDVLAEKHSSDRGYSDVDLIVGWAAIRATYGPGMAVGWGTFLMGVAWLAVGIRIPSRLPSAPAPPPPVERA